jgi:hypothetical protein
MIYRNVLLHCRLAQGVPSNFDVSVRPVGREACGKHHPFGNASDQKMPQPRASVRAHDDPVTTLTSGNCNDLLNLVAFGDMVLDVKSLGCRHRAAEVFGDAPAVADGLKLATMCKISTNAECWRARSAAMPRA